MASVNSSQGNNIPIPVINVPDSPRSQSVDGNNSKEVQTSPLRSQPLADGERMSTDSDSALGTDDDEYDNAQLLNSGKACLESGG